MKRISKFYLVGDYLIEFLIAHLVSSLKWLLELNFCFLLDVLDSSKWKINSPPHPLSVCQNFWELILFELFVSRRNLSTFVKTSFGKFDFWETDRKQFSSVACRKFPSHQVDWLDVWLFHRLPCTTTQYKSSINYFSRLYNKLAQNETRYFSSFSRVSWGEQDNGWD